MIRALLESLRLSLHSLLPLALNATRQLAHQMSLTLLRSPLEHRSQRFRLPPLSAQSAGAAGALTCPQSVATNEPCQRSETPRVQLELRRPG